MRLTSALILTSLWFTSVLAAPEASNQANNVIEANGNDVDFQEGQSSADGVNAQACYVCSSPCSSIYCCNTTGYPQCCAVNGRCGCCAV